MKKKVCCNKYGQKKKFVGGIDEKYVDQNKPANFNMYTKQGRHPI